MYISCLYFSPGWLFFKKLVLAALRYTGTGLKCSRQCFSFQVPPGKKGTEKGGTAEGVEVTLNPEELDLDTAAMQAKYDETVREQQSQLEKEDLSDMVAAHAAKQRVSTGPLFVYRMAAALPSGH